MAIDSIQLCGKTLPIYFSVGYLSAFMVAMGRSNVMSYYQIASHNLDPGQSPAAKKSWLDPLYRYFGIGTGEPQPLDYFFLRLIQDGISRTTPPKERVVPGVTRRVGKIWWFGDAPISTYQDRQSLHCLLANTIWRKLDTYKFGAPNIDYSSVKSSNELIQIGLEIFVEELTRPSGIDCRVRHNQKNTRLELTISECPFCLGQSSLCRVFVGVIEGLLEWLHGAHQPNAISSRIIINEQATTGHSIILDLK